MRSLPAICLLAAVIVGLVTDCSASRGHRQVISRQEIQQLFGILPPPSQAPAVTSDDPAANSTTSLQASQDATGHSYASAPPASATSVLGESTATQQPVGVSGPTASQPSPAWTLTGPPGISSDPRSTGWEALFHSPSPVPAGASMAALNPAFQGALQKGAVQPPADPAPAGRASQLADNAAQLIAADAAAASLGVTPSPSRLPFGDKDPYGDAAASRGGAMPAAYQPHQAIQGHSPAPYMPDQAAPEYMNRLFVGTLGNAESSAFASYQVVSPPSQAITGNAAAPVSGDAAASPAALQSAAATPDQALQGSASSVAVASPADAAAPPPAPPLPASPQDQASQGGLNTSPAQPPSGTSPDSQQAASAHYGDVPVQPYALPPVMGSTQSDQHPLLTVYRDSADRWRKIAIAGIVLLLLLAGAVLACSLCHLILTRQLEKPAAMQAKKGRYRGMQEFEMPEIKSHSWAMP